MDFLSWFALAIMFSTVLVLVYGVIAIHDIPYNIAKSRNHPHREAIHAAGWVSLVTLHAIWPFLWIWATCYDPQHGYSGKPDPAGDADLEPSETDDSSDAGQGSARANQTSKVQHSQSDPSEGKAQIQEAETLRQRVAELEQQLKAASAPETE